MEINKNILEKYARLAVRCGANVQKGQFAVVNCSVENYEFARIVVKEAYEAGASEVLINYIDDELNKLDYENVETDILKQVPSWAIDKYKSYIDKKACFIHIRSIKPGLLKDIDSNKLQEVTIETSKAMQPFRYYTMASHGQWTLLSVPNPVWAKKVFPELEEKEAVQKLWESILKTVYVDEENDPLEVWEKHNKDLKYYTSKLNEYNLKSLHFKNNLGTDLIVELVNNHIWRGGQDKTLSGIPFNPNLPTEEAFCMPKRTGVNGIVYATKPLNYQGQLIENFWIKFKDGKAIEFKAEKGEAALKNLIDLDEGSSYLGEVALISYNTPICNMDILFYDTLFDENASCHLALGAAYPTNMKDGENMTPEQLVENGCNVSMAHSDFMFGSEDMEIIGELFTGEKVQIFKNGNFVI